MKPTVLVVTTTRWFPTARLAMALSGAGFAVEALCTPNHCLVKTRGVRRSHPYVGVRPLRSLAAGIAAARPDLLVPGDDLAAHQLHLLSRQEARRNGSRSAVCALIERSLGAHENFPILFARTPFMAFARRQGVRAPRTEVISGLDELRRWVADVGFPVVLKADGSTGGLGVQIAHSMEQAQRAFRQVAAPPMLVRTIKRTLLDHDSSLLVDSLARTRSVVNAQAFVPGREATSAVACWKGEVLAGLHFEVLQKSKTTGYSSVIRLLEHDEMSAAVEQIVHSLGLSGIHGFDFMLDSEGGNAHLIEINPRATQCGHLTFGPGRDLPAALYSAVSGEPLSPAPKVTENRTIALFPQEWTRDVASPFLQSAYHDVPWDQPEFVLACIRTGRKKRFWHSPETEVSELFPAHLSAPDRVPVSRE